MNAVLVLSGSVLYLERQKENSLVTVLEVDDIPLLHSASFKLRYYVTPERSSTFGTDSRFPPVFPVSPCPGPAAVSLSLRCLAKLLIQ